MDIPEFVLKNRETLASLSDVRTKLDEILCEGAYDQIIEHLMFNDWYSAWDAIRSIVHRLSESFNQREEYLRKLAKLGAQLQSHTNKDIRYLARYLIEQNK